MQSKANCNFYNANCNFHRASAVSSAHSCKKPVQGYFPFEQNINRHNVQRQRKLLQKQPKLTSSSLYLSHNVQIGQLSAIEILRRAQSEYNGVQGQFVHLKARWRTIWIQPIPIPTPICTQPIPVSAIVDVFNWKKRSNLFDRKKKAGCHDQGWRKRSVGWTGWWTGWCTGWCTGWWTGWWAGWCTGWWTGLLDRLMYRLVDRLVDRVVGQVSVQGKPLCFEISSRLQICPISFSDVIVHSETQSLWLLAEMFTIPFLFDLDLWKANEKQRGGKWALNFCLTWVPDLSDQWSHLEGQLALIPFPVLHLVLPLIQRALVQWIWWTCFYNEWSDTTKRIGGELGTGKNVMKWRKWI